MSVDDIVRNVRPWELVSRTLGRPYFICEQENGSTVEFKPELYLLAHPCYEGTDWYVKKELVNDES